MEVRLSNAVIGSERPSLEIGEDAMDPRHHDVRRHFSDDLRLVVIAFQAFVGREAVTEDGGASLSSAGDEGADTGCGKVFQRREADTARLTFGRKLDCADDVQFANRAAALAAGDRVGFGAVGDIAFVDLDDVFQDASVRIDHRPAQFLQHQPCGLIRTEAQLRLKLQRRDAVGMAGDGVDRLEPSQKW